MKRFFLTAHRRVRLDPPILNLLAILQGGWGGPLFLKRPRSVGEGETHDFHTHGSRFESQDSQVPLEMR